MRKISQNAYSCPLHARVCLYHKHMNQYASSFHDFFTDRQGRPAVIQWPNAPAWLLMAAVAARLFISEGGRLPFDIAIIVIMAYWAVLELKDGLSSFRQLLGLAGLVIAGTYLFIIVLSR